MKLFANFIGLAIVVSLALVDCAPLLKRAPSGPVITSDFPDPSIVHIGDIWYAFGTQSLYDNKEIRVQLATSPDFSTWTLSKGVDALRTLPPWADASDSKVWAPEVIQIDDGTFLMYFSATTLTGGDGRFHCVGTATSHSISGPYDSNSDTPFACPLEKGGAIDASGFRDTNGARYVVYKIDANAIGNGGVCNNQVPPIQETSIMLQRVEEDGLTKIGDEIKILANGEYDGGNIQAPVMSKAADGTYVLYFSSNCYTTADYATSYATGPSPTGPFEKTAFPLLLTGNGIWGPGGASVTVGGEFMAFHGYASEEDVGGRRAMYVAHPVHVGDRVSV